jgi:SAM-dependent methyltransferase
MIRARMIASRPPAVVFNPVRVRRPLGVGGYLAGHPPGQAGKKTPSGREPTGLVRRCAAGRLQAVESFDERPERRHENRGTAKLCREELMKRQDHAPSTVEQVKAFRQVLTGFITTRILEAATKMRIPEALEAGPADAADLAKAVGADALSLRRLMQALTAVGVFDEDAEGRFHLTPISELLLEDHPTSLRQAVLYYTAPYVEDAWKGLEQGVRTGKCAFEEEHGASYWSYLDAHPDDAAVFNEYLSKFRPYRHASVVKAYDFSSMETVVDIGGGYGQQLARILEANPSVRGVLFDAPSVEAGATEYLATQGVADRCRFVAGDFFAAVPEGGDAYILGDIVHDWSDADSVSILTTCRRAMKPQSRLLMVEMLMSPEAVYFDLHMMVLFGEARQRSEDEFRSILQQSGLELVRVIPTESEASVVEAAPV